MTVLRVVVQTISGGSLPAFDFRDGNWPVWASGEDGNPTEWDLKKSRRVLCSFFEVANESEEQMRGEFLEKLLQFPIQADLPGTAIILVRNDCWIMGHGKVHLIESAILFSGDPAHRDEIFGFPDNEDRCAWIPRKIDDPKGMGEHLKKMLAVWEVMLS